MASSAYVDKRQSISKVKHQTMKIAVLPGDGIGTEIVAEAVKAPQGTRPGSLKWNPPWSAPTIDAHGHPCPKPPETGQRGGTPSCRCWATGIRRQARPPLRPEQPWGSWACARTWACSPTSAPPSATSSLVGASSLKPRLVAGLDILIIRELTGDIYFGQPRGPPHSGVDGHFPALKKRFDTMRYSRPEIERIAHVAFQAAQSATRRSPAWTRPTCWKPSSSGRTWSPRWPAVPRRGTAAHVRGQRRHATGQGPRRLT